MSTLEDALRDYDFASASTRHMAAAALAQAVRDHLQSPLSSRKRRNYAMAADDDDDLYVSGDTSNGTRALRLSIVSDRPFHYDGILYNTAQNAFQAQKAPKEKRAAFAGIEHWPRSLGKTRAPTRAPTRATERMENDGAWRGR